MSSALFKQGTYDDVVNWIWSLGDISSGGMQHALTPVQLLVGVTQSLCGTLNVQPVLHCLALEASLSSNKHTSSASRGCSAARELA